MATQTPYEVLGVKPTPAPTKSARPTASWRRSFIPISTPASPRPRPGSRRCRRPTISCPTPKSGRATTAARSTKAAPSGRAIPIARMPRAREGWQYQPQGEMDFERSRRSVRRRSARRAARGRRRRAAGRVGEGFAMRGGDRHFTLTVDFAEAATGDKKRLALTPDEWLDVTIPPGIEDRPDPAPEGQGRPRLRRRRDRRCADRGACRAAPALPARRRRHPYRIAGQPRRGGAGRAHPGADRDRAGDDDDPQGLRHRRGAAAARQGHPAPGRDRATST